MITISASVIFVSDQQGVFRIVISHNGGNEWGSGFVDSIPLCEQDVKNLGSQVLGTLLEITKTEITEKNFSGSWLHNCFLCLLTNMCRMCVGVCGRIGYQGHGREDLQVSPTRMNLISVSDQISLDQFSQCIS